MNSWSSRLLSPLTFYPYISWGDVSLFTLHHSYLRKVSESRSIMSDSLQPPEVYMVHGILQDRKLEWAAFPFSRGSSQPRDQTQVSHIAGRFLPAEPQGKPKNTRLGSLSLLQRIFPTKESNRGPLLCRQRLYQLSYDSYLDTQ